MAHKGKNYSIKPRKYYFCNGTNYAIKHSRKLFKPSFSI
jgi:hypothetical protein